MSKFPLVYQLMEQCGLRRCRICQDLMPLSGGTRIGPYEIVAIVGAGGMGEVYKARDTRLGRTVAIKFCSARFNDRFHREAQAIASLNHPHICALYDVGPNYLVMEWIEGQPLKGPLPLPEALRLAIQIAGSLDAAHRAGIVHRDLKPANILVTKTGVKLLDFGLAKHTHDYEGSDIDATQTMSLTEKGVLLGTYPYMSPEQLEGKNADARSDVFAFGAVLYEMLTGRRAFQRDRRASTIAAIMHNDPPVRSEVTDALQPVLWRCLAKDPDDRWQSAADLKWALQHMTSARASFPTSRRWSSALAILFAIAAVVGYAVWFLQSVPEIRSFRFQLTPPEAHLSRRSRAGTISLDGRLVVFVAGPKGSLWVRPLDSLVARELPGTEGASYPFWSPNSKSLGFFAYNKLKRIDIATSSPQSLCDAPDGRGGSWSADGTIVFAPRPNSGLQYVSASGGVAGTATSMDSAVGESSHRWPEFLPESRRFLYVVQSGRTEHRGLYVGSLNERELKAKVANTEFNALYTPPHSGQPGYLLWVRERTLIAQRFDPRHVRLEGGANPIIDNVALDSSFSLADFSVSANGILLYQAASIDQRRIVWMDRKGKVIGTVAEPGAYYGPRLSPDGARLALSRMDSSGHWNVWLLEFARGLLTRLTFDSTEDLYPVWSPDGREIAFASQRAGPFNIYREDASGTGRAERLTHAGSSQVVCDWTWSGPSILYEEGSTQTRGDLWLLPINGNRKPIPLVRTPFDETAGQVSPDGRWIAYSSDESGRYEVYVKEFPSPGGKWQVSTHGGGHPRWRADSKELFYVSADNALMAATLKASGSRLEPDTPLVLFPLAPQSSVTSYEYPYDVGPDGRRFVVLQPAEEAKAKAVTVVINWNAGLPK